jgi:aminotransferase EvaB
MPTERRKAALMAVPFNDTRRRFAACRSQLFAAWEMLFDEGIFIGGVAVDSFERDFAIYCGIPNCISLANGTDALEFSLRALDVRAGDEVITVANAGGYTTAACHAIGALPVYVDVDTRTCQLDPNCIEQAPGNKTRAIVVTHLYGFMNDVAAIRAQLSSLGRGDIAIVEDCAQAHGASYHGQNVGSIGDAAAFSFYPTKNLGALGDAGAVLCRNTDVATKIRQLRQYGWQPKYHTVLSGGRNSRMDALQAIVLKQQLRTLAASNAKRRDICRMYANNLPQGWTIICANDSRFVGHLAVAIAPDPQSRRHACDLLRQRDVGYDIHYPILDCDQVGWQGRGRCVGNLDESRCLTQRILSLPCFAEMTEDELGEVIDALHAFPGA